MPKGTYWANGCLRSLLLNEDLPGISRGLEKPGSLWMSLHKREPDGASQLVNEVKYTGYSRIEIPRTSASFTFNPRTGKMSLARNFDFPEVLGGVRSALPDRDKADYASHFGIGLSKTGAGNLCVYAELDERFMLFVGLIPRLTPDTSFKEI